MAFSMNYQQPYYPYTPQMPAAPMMQNPTPTANNTQSNLTWVQGEAGAKSYLVAPNTTVQLWDSEAQTIYLKSADASGMPSMKILDYTIRDAAQVQQTTPAIQPMSAPPMDYVTHEELRDFKEEIKSMIKTPTAKKGVSKDE